jgi:hypothetical protein
VLRFRHGPARLHSEYVLLTHGVDRVLMSLVDLACTRLVKPVAGREFELIIEP